jgi:hypothetical protein
MKKLTLLVLLLATGCVSRISIEDGVTKDSPVDETPSVESAVQEVAPVEKA